NRYSVSTISSSWRKESQPGVGLRTSVNVFFGILDYQPRAGATNAGSGDSSLVGFQLTQTFDARNIGVTVGVLGGHYLLSTDEPGAGPSNTASPGVSMVRPRSYLPALGLRLGPLTGLYGEAGLFNTMVMQPTAVSPWGTLSLGYGSRTGDAH